MIAIDVAVLPPEEIMQAAIALNHALPDQPKQMHLAREQRLPHITLLQAAVDKKTLPEIQAQLEQIAGSFGPLSLQARLVSDNGWIYLKLQRTRQLLDLHKNVIEKIDRLVSFDAKTADFADKHVEASIVSSLRNFKRTSAQTNYNPHITVGVGETKDLKANLSFQASCLALGALGNFGTFKRVLYKTKL